jgi:hypothetical protein
MSRLAKAEPRKRNLFGPSRYWRARERNRPRSPQAVPVQLPPRLTAGLHHDDTLPHEVLHDLPDIPQWFPHLLRQCLQVPGDEIQHGEKDLIAEIDVHQALPLKRGIESLQFAGHDTGHQVPLGGQHGIYRRFPPREGHLDPVHVALVVRQKAWADIRTDARLDGRLHDLRRANQASPAEKHQDLLGRENVKFALALFLHVRVPFAGRPAQPRERQEQADEAPVLLLLDGISGRNRFNSSGPISRGRARAGK